MEKVLPLSQEQNTKRLLFIGKCVDENLTIPNYTKFGVNQPMTVQDLSAASDSTLKGIYIAIQKQVNESTLGFDNTKEVVISGIPANDWLEFIKFTVKGREYKVYQSELFNEKLKSSQELDSMKSPSQKKRDLQKRLTELEA